MKAQKIPGQTLKVPPPNPAMPVISRKLPLARIQFRQIPSPHPSNDACTFCSQLHLLAAACSLLHFLKKNSRPNAYLSNHIMKPLNISNLRSQIRDQSGGALVL